MQRPTVHGKFLFDGNRKLWVRGVTYGTFRPDAAGHLVPAPEAVRADFAAMARCGVNAVRTYTPPPCWLLDLAQEAGLRVMVGLWWEQFVAFLDARGRPRAIERAVRDAVQALAGHPAVLCYAIANEIPPSIVRWHGRRRIEAFLRRLYDAVKAEDPGALVTYVNYPTTEYLQLPFLDLVAFNVYLESRQRLEAYLARLQNLADDRPLLMAEIGLDSRRHGEDRQAEVLRWQLDTAFAAGCCGAFVFAWTDEWCCGGHDIVDWDFGLVRRDRGPKPALAAVRDAYAATPFRAGPLGVGRRDTDAGGPAAGEPEWPRISVVVCSYNGSRTIRDTLDGLQALDYPDYEVIVVDDGSTDRTAEIASEYPVRLISTENRGLSSARNTGCEAATGGIVAYIDDDAWPDPHWLRYLALEYRRADIVGVGGPNLPPPGDGPIADCVANAPGGPVHVLLDDRVAEHIPGCNMSFRREVLRAAGGFDPIYRAAGDDVDLCWRLQDRGGVIGFAAAAVVWHHRRNSVRMYWKQQRGYGKAEALLERKWPERYNAAGHLRWQGRLYGRGWTLGLDRLGGRIYRGVWNTAPFQSLYQRQPSTLLALPLMPEWLLVVAALAALSLLGFAWRPLLFGLPLLAVAAAFPVAQALVSASRARFTSARTRADRVRLFALTAFLHLLQPLARLVGRIQHGLVPWRRRGPDRKLWRVRAKRAAWREVWKAPEARLEALYVALRRAGAVAWRGGDYDDWDLAVRGGWLGGARLRMAVEEHGAGKQMVRFRLWAQVPASVIVVAAVLGALGAGALADGAVPAGAVILLAAIGLLGAAAADAARALATLASALPAAELEAALAAASESVALQPLPEPSAGDTAWVEVVLPSGQAEASEKARRDA